MVALDPTGVLSLDVGLLRGASWKLPCRVATTANVTIATALNVGDSIDGVTLVAGDRVLVKNQTTGSQNGIYVVGATPVRAFDMDQDATTAVQAQEVLGTVALILEGTANGGTFWRCTNTTAPVLGTTALTFAALPSVDLSGIDYLVGTASGLLSAEIVAGTVPGGEFGGTWASPNSRSVVLQLTNRSAGSVAAGDVVVIDTVNDSAFTTTTSGQAEVSLGIAQATIASTATGPVKVAGYAALVNVPASVTRGHFIETHTVAKQATGSATRRAGSFGQFLTGGTTPAAWLWGAPDQTASGGGGSIEAKEDNVSVVAAATIFDFTHGLDVGNPGGGRATVAVDEGEITHNNLGGLTTGDPHTQYQQESEKGAANGYASLDSGILVPIAQIPTGTTGSTVALGNHSHAPGGGGTNKALVFGLPTGTFARSYTWATTVESWTTTGGTLSSTSGWLRQAGTGVALEPSGAANVADGEVICDFRVPNSSGSQSLIFRATDASNFYMWTFQPGTSPTLYKCVAGGFTLLFNLQQDQRSGPLVNKVRMLTRFEGSSLDLYINGTLIGHCNDTTFTTGRIGIRADTGTLEIDNMDIFSSVDLVTGNVSTP